MSERHDGAMVTLTSRPTEPAAAIVVAALNDAGIKATMTGQFTSGFKAEAPGWVAIKVFETDRAAAEQVVADLAELKNEPIDWSQVDVGQPLDEEHEP